MNPITDLKDAWTGLAMIVAGKPEEAGKFNATPNGLVVALGWFLLALLLGTAAQSATVGMPGLEQVLVGLGIQAVTLAVLAVAITQSLHFLKLGVPMTALLVPIVWFMALLQIVIIPFNLAGLNVELISALVLSVLVWRCGTVIGGMRTGVAIAFALLCLMVLVIVPTALYMLFLTIPSPA